MVGGGRGMEGDSGWGGRGMVGRWERDGGWGGEVGGRKRDGGWEGEG